MKLQYYFSPRNFQQKFPMFSFLLEMHEALIIIIIIIITYLYIAFRSEDTEALDAAQED